MMNTAQESLTSTLNATLSAQYGFSPSSRWRLAARGQTHRTWFVTEPGSHHPTVVVRRYHAGFDEQTIACEHAILHYLRQHRFPVPRVMASRQNQSVVRVGQDRYSVFEYCPGQPATFLSRRLQPGILRVAGETLGRYHQLVKRFPIDGLKRQETECWLIDAFLRQRKQLLTMTQPAPFAHSMTQQLEEMVAWLKDVCPRLDENRQHAPLLLVHGDFGPQNVLFQHTTVLAVLDFSNVHVNAPVVDVARAVAMFAKGLGPQLDLGLARKFLRAYRTHRDFRAGELAWFPAEIILSRLVSLYYQLTQYCDEGHQELRPKIVQLMTLIRWLKAHEARLVDLCVTR